MTASPAEEAADAEDSTKKISSSAAESRRGAVSPRPAAPAKVSQSAEEDTLERGLPEADNEQKDTVGEYLSI